MLYLLGWGWEEGGKLWMLQLFVSLKSPQALARRISAGKEVMENGCPCFSPPWHPFLPSSVHYVLLPAACLYFMVSTNIVSTYLGNQVCNVCVCYIEQNKPIYISKPKFSDQNYLFTCLDLYPIIYITSCLQDTSSVLFDWSCKKPECSQLYKWSVYARVSDSFDTAGH